MHAAPLGLVGLLRLFRSAFPALHHDVTLIGSPANSVLPYPYVVTLA